MTNIGMPNALLRGVAMGVLLTSGVGCANQLGELDLDEVSTIERKLVRTEYDAELAGALLEEGRELQISAPQLTRKLVRLKTYEKSVVVYKYTHRNVTPYDGSREFVEVPLGLVSVPLSFGLHVLRIGTLFFVPGELVADYTAWTFSALNPAMNVEDSDRIKRERIGQRKYQIEEADIEREIDREPVVEEDVEVLLVFSDARGDLLPAEGFPANGAVRAKPGPSGVLSVHLLDLMPDDLPGRPVAVEFRVLVEGANPIRRSLTSALEQRLYESHRPLVAVRKGTSGAEVSADIAELYNKGWREYALTAIEVARARLLPHEQSLFDFYLPEELKLAQRYPDTPDVGAQPR